MFSKDINPAVRPDCITRVNINIVEAIAIVTIADIVSLGHLSHARTTKGINVNSWRSINAWNAQNIQPSLFRAAGG